MGPGSSLKHERNRVCPAQNMDPGMEEEMIKPCTVGVPELWRPPPAADEEVTQGHQRFACSGVMGTAPQAPIPTRVWTFSSDLLQVFEGPFPARPQSRQELAQESLPLPVPKPDASKTPEEELGHLSCTAYSLCGHGSVTSPLSQFLHP